MSRDLMILFAIAMALMVMQMIGGFLVFTSLEMWAWDKSVAGSLTVMSLLLRVIPITSLPVERP